MAFFNESAPISKKLLSEDLVMQNVEALSSVELKPYKYYTCYSSIHEKDGCMVLYSPECTYVSGTDDFFSSSDRCMHR